MRTYADVAALYIQHRLHPIPVKGKRPVPAGSTGRKGTVTKAQVEAWLSDPEWSQANTALRHEGTIGIDVDHYGPKRGAEQLAELEARLGPLPATITSTSRGADSASRQHFYRLPDPEVELVGKAGADIEIIQRHHRYSVVWPSLNPDADGAAYLWYDYDGTVLAEPPSLEDFEMLPDAWVEHLRADTIERPAQHEQFDGETPAVASPDEERKLRAIIGALRGLPDVWAPGAGWHDTVYRMACWLSRMVNSNAYALTADQAATILLEHTPTYPAWGEEKIVEQWESAVRSTEGQFEEPPLAARPPLLHPLDALNNVPAEVYDLAMSEPHNVGPGALWDMRHRLMVAVLRTNPGAEVLAASIAWHALHAGRELRDDPYGLEKLWKELDQAAVKAAASTGATVEAAPASERPPLHDDDEKITLLTVTERAFLATEDARWWGERYLEWAKTRVGMWNAPYHRMNRWMILSLVFSPYGFIPKKKGPMFLNLFGMVLGKTTTGKTEAMEITRSVLRACFITDDPDIGGDASPNSLTEKLIERDGKPSFFNADEAHGLFKEMQGATWRAGLRERWTDFYEGRVRMILRAMKKDVSGQHAKTYFVMHLMGTSKEMTEVMDAEFWTSGFLARFAWAIGEDLEIAADELEVDEVDGDVQAAYDAMPKQWAAEFAAVTRRMSTEVPQPVRFDADAKARHLDFMRVLHAIYTGHRHEEMLKPTLIRFGDIIRKCAALVAMSEGRFTISLRDELLALEQAEEWLENALLMARRTTETGFARNVDEVERFIAGSAGSAVKKERVYRHMSPKHEKYEVDRYLTQLIAEGRIQEESAVDGGRLLKIKTEGALAA